MGNNLNKMSFSLTDSDWTNSLSIYSHHVDSDLNGDGEIIVTVDDRGNSSNRTIRDVSWSLSSDGVDVLENQMKWVKGVKWNSMDLNELFIYLNFAFLVLNFSVLGKF